MGSPSSSVLNSVDVIRECIARMGQVFVCSSCLGDFDSPTRITVCGHAFCKACVLERVQERDAVCPDCKVPIYPKDIVEDRALRDLLIAFRKICARFEAIQSRDALRTRDSRKDVVDGQSPRGDCIAANQSAADTSDEFAAYGVNKHRFREIEPDLLTKSYRPSRSMDQSGFDDQGDLKLVRIAACLNDLAGDVDTASRSASMFSFSSKVCEKMLEDNFGKHNRKTKHENNSSGASRVDVVPLPTVHYESLGAQTQRHAKVRALGELKEAEEELCSVDRIIAELEDSECRESDCDSDIPTIVIGYSGISELVFEQCRRTVRELGGELVSKIDSRTPLTHLVVDVSDLNELKNYSLKVYYAMVKRVPVVSPKWLTACFEQGAWVEEHPYEAFLCHNHGGKHVFGNVVASTHGQFLSPPNMNVKDVRGLLVCGGAELADAGEVVKLARHKQKLAIIVVDSAHSGKFLEVIYEGAKIVGVSWLTDCITTGCCPPTNEAFYETLNSASSELEM